MRRLGARLRGRRTADAPELPGRRGGAPGFLDDDRMRVGTSVSGRGGFHGLAGGAGGAERPLDVGLVSSTS